MDAVFVRQDGRIEDRICDTLFLLRQIAAEGHMGVFIKAGDGVEVSQAQKPHEEVGQIPDQRKLGHAAENHHEDDQCPEDEQAHPALGFKEGDLPVAEEISSTELSLPMYYGMTQEEIDAEHAAAEAAAAEAAAEEAPAAE